MDRSSTELVYAAVSKLKEDGQNRFASIIEYLAKHPEALDQFQDMTKKPHHREIFTAPKALGLLLSLKLSKWQSITLREFERVSIMYTLLTIECSKKRKSAIQLNVTPLQ